MKPQEIWKDGQNYSGQDANSNESPIYYPQFVVSQYLSDNLISNGTFNTSISPWHCWGSDPAGNSCSASQVNNVGLDGGALRLTFTSFPGNSYLLGSINIPPVSSNETYLFETSSLGSFNGKDFEIELRRDGTPYGLIADRASFPLQTTAKRDEHLFTIHTSENAPRLDIKLDESDQLAYFDNMSLRKVKVESKNPNDYYRFEYNSSLSNISFVVNHDYMDPKGNFYSKGQNITLSPYSSIVLMKVNIVSSTETLNSKKQELQVFPNPVHDVLIFKTENHNQPLIVYNSVGSVVYSSSFVPKTMDVAQWSRGFYFASTINNVVKLIKK